MTHLTDYEEAAGCTSVWLPLAEALALFGNYEALRSVNTADYGLYKREYLALKEYVDAI